MLDEVKKPMRIQGAPRMARKAPNALARRPFRVAMSDLGFSRTIRSPRSRIIRPPNTINAANNARNIESSIRRLPKYMGDDCGELGEQSRLQRDEVVTGGERSEAGRQKPSGVNCLFRIKGPVFTDCEEGILNSLIGVTA